MTTGSPTASQTPRLTAGLLTLVLATSSIVFIEPAPYDLLLVALLVGCLSAGMRWPREIWMAAVLLGCFVISNVVAAALSSEPAETIRSLSIRTYMVLGWLTFVGLVVAEPRQHLTAIWRGYVIAAVIAVAWGVMEYFGVVSGELWLAGLRAKGPFKDANVFGPFLVPVAIYCVKEIYTSGGRRAWLYLPLALAVTFGIFLSFSRGAWLSLMLAFAVFGMCAFASARSLRQRLGLLLLSGVLVLAAAAIVARAVSSPEVAARFYERAVIARAYDLKEGGRFYTQRQSLERIADSPLGVGPGRTDEEFGLEPHNLYLHVIVEGGWLAGFGFYGFIALTLLRVWSLFRWRSPLRADFFVIFASLAGALSQSFFIDSTHWRHLWMLLGLMWALIVLHRRELVHETAAPVPAPAGDGLLGYLRRRPAPGMSRTPDNPRRNPASTPGVTMGPAGCREQGIR